MYKFCLLFLGFIYLINAGDSDDYDDNVDDILKFRFEPLKSSNCYQVYNSTDTINALTCRWEHKESRRSCVTGLKDNDDYCEISTPSGESVRVPCYTSMYTLRVNSPDLDYSFKKAKGPPECFETYKNGKYIKKICPEAHLFHKKYLSVGIVTPDGYKILLYSKLCKAFKNKAEINADLEFTSTFTFDPKERSCYKIYTQDQPISQYTCSDDHILYTRIHRSCVENWEIEDKCRVVKTQNNETVILECEGETRNTTNCFNIYKDGNTTEVCMEILEEGCMGITTPSGLRMLFACRACGIEKYYPAEYDKEKFKRRSKFVQKYLKNEMRKKNNYYRSHFEIIQTGYKKDTRIPFWLSDSNCSGFTSGNETIIFKCTDREFSPGCFKVKNVGEKNETDICAFVYEEKCVIVETPKGKRIILGCYDEWAAMEQIFVKNELQNFKNGSYTIDTTNSDIKKVYKIENGCRPEIEDYQTQWLHEHQCWGVVTPNNEKILLECPNNENKNKTGCFQVYAQNYTSDNEILPFSYETYEVCAEIINDICVGVITRKGWNVQLSCFSYLYHPRCCGTKPIEEEDE